VRLRQVVHSKLALGPYAYPVCRAGDRVAAHWVRQHRQHADDDDLRRAAPAVHHEDEVQQRAYERQQYAQRGDVGRALHAGEGVRHTHYAHRPREGEEAAADYEQVDNDSECNIHSVPSRYLPISTWLRKPSMAVTMAMSR